MTIRKNPSPASTLSVLLGMTEAISHGKDFGKKVAVNGREELFGSPWFHQSRKKKRKKPSEIYFTIYEVKVGKFNRFLLGGIIFF